MLEKFLQKPKNIFLFDGFGAMVSIFFLGGVLVYFERYFGISKSTLYLLAFFPCLFLMYDLVCFYFIQTRLGVHIKTVAILNLCYVLLSVFMIFKDFSLITYLGYFYLVIEISILLFLIPFEWKFSSKFKILNKN